VDDEDAQGFGEGGGTVDGGGCGVQGDEAHDGATGDAPDVKRVAVPTVVAVTGVYGPG
jgi:hypothetical protein